MLSISMNECPYPSDQPQYLSITRIEVFVIPSLAIDSHGNRVCLRMSSDHGYGWSEQFVSDSESSLQLDRWRPLLRTFIGRFPLNSLTDRLTARISETVNPDNRAFKLFAAALQSFPFQYAQGTTALTDIDIAEESVLQQRAVAYLSVE